MPKTIAYTALHYGSPYLYSAIKSVIDHVDRYVVLYSRYGSHGTQVITPPPESESRENLQRIAQLGAGDKLEWYDVDATNEGQHRDTIEQYTEADDLILTLDYDEIWPTHMLDETLEYMRDYPHRAYRLPMIHFWRSFHQAVCHDPALPVRAWHRGHRETQTLNFTAPILHFGYAIPSWLMEYKRLIHGHRAEFRRDIDWLSERWENPDATEDLHPVGSDYWTIEPVDDLPDLLRVHPFYGLERIE